eukprot:40354-Eustigmatos_ZCMA.PRE.1
MTGKVERNAVRVKTKDGDERYDRQSRHQLRFQALLQVNHPDVVNEISPTASEFGSESCSASGGMSDITSMPFGCMTLQQVPYQS